MELKGELLCQPWGVPGDTGLAARLYAKDKKVDLEPDLLYGELILGGDRHCHTYVVSKDLYLADLFKGLAPECLGDTAFCHFRNRVPFTLRVLSIGSASPLVCYPGPKKARVYHLWNRKAFVTPGTRSHIVIALEDFCLLFGFRKLEHIVEVFNNAPEMVHLIGEELINRFLETKSRLDFLRLFEKLLDALPSQIQHARRLLTERMRQVPPVKSTAYRPYKLFTRLCSQYPDDVGVFFPYFLNAIKLKRTEGILVHAGLPIAYLQGEAIECSNSVDNPTKAAFSSRRDVTEFLGCVNARFISCKDIRDHYMVYTQEVVENVREYMTKCTAFRLFMGIIPRAHKHFLPPRRSFTIVLIVEGSGVMNGDIVFMPGSAFLFAAQKEVNVITLENVVYVQVGVNYLS